jgi:hypothetical protein
MNSGPDAALLRKCGDKVPDTGYMIPVSRIPFARFIRCLSEFTLDSRDESFGTRQSE